MNLIERVNRLFSWKNQHFNHHQDGRTCQSATAANEYQLQSHGVESSNDSSISSLLDSWQASNNTNDTTNNNNIASHSLTELSLPQSLSTMPNNNNVNNTDAEMSVINQPLISQTSNPSNDNIEIETVPSQSSVTFSLPSTSIVNARNINNRPIPLNIYGTRVNATTNETNLPSSSRSRRSAGRHRSIRSSHRSNNHHSTSNTSQHIRSFLSSSTRRSSASAASSSTSSSANRYHSYRQPSNSNNNSLNFLFSNMKKRERNLLSACCAVFSIAILSVSLVETRWFYLNGGGCNVNYIGVAHFFAPGRLEYQVETSKITKTEIYVYNFILPNGLVLKNCANKEIMLIMRTIIAFVFMAIFSACIGLMLDTFGCMKSGIKLVRRHAIFHILTVIFCLVINGFCFWISEKMNEQQIETRTKKGKKIDVSFDVSYYLIVLASGLSIMATAFTLIRRYSTDEDDQLERLLEEYTGFEDPIHLERSLPATTTIINTSSPIQNLNENYFLNMLSNENCNDRSNSQSSRNFTNSRCLLSSSTQYNVPPPPATPPPPLHHHLINDNSNSVSNVGNRDINNNRDAPLINELPPPYDPTPVIA